MGKATHKPAEGSTLLVADLARKVRRLNQGGSIGAGRVRPLTSQGKPTDAMFTGVPDVGTQVYDVLGKKPYWRAADGQWRDALGSL